MQNIVLISILGSALFLSPGLALAQRNVRAAGKPSQQAASLVSLHASGSVRYPEADITAATGLKVGNTLTPQDFRTGADKLAASGAFEEVRYKYELAGTGYSVTYEVVDSPESLPVTFDNFAWFSDNELVNLVKQSVPLFHGEVPINGGMLQQVADALQAVLAQRGIAGTVRFLREETSDGNTGGGVFTIDGLNMRIRRVDFPGAPEDDGPMLGQTARLLIDKPYQRSVVRSFADASIRPLYLKRGFLRVTFGDAHVEVLNADTRAPEVAVKIPVIPGAQYRISQIEWAGNKAFYPEDLEAAVKLKTGSIADAIQLEADLHQVQALYGAKGYLRAATEVTPAYDEDRKVVRYTIHVREGGVYRFRSIDLQGIDKATIARLREEWTLREGEPFNNQYPREYIKALARLLPPNVSIEPSTEIDDEAKTVDYTVKLILR